jgi:polyisoprenoid-binding protein YceI
MRKLIVLLIALALATPQLSAAAWKIDRTHSYVGFSVMHMVVSKVKGQFNEFDGTVNFDGKDFATASVEVNVDPRTIDTGNERRDGHLKSSDFFAADSLPTMTFKSKKVIPGKSGAFQIIGELTMRGVTKEVTLDAQFNGSVTDPGGNTRAGFSATGRLNRQDWGVSWSKTLDAGGLVVSDEVQLVLEIEAISQP